MLKPMSAARLGALFMTEMIQVWTMDARNIPTVMILVENHLPC